MMYQNDQWDVTDKLGMEAAGDRLAKMVLHVTPPFTTAIVGKWGAGKTSLMQRAFATLGGDPISKAVPLGGIEKYADTHRDTLPLSIKQESRKTELGWEDGLYKVADHSLCVWYSPWQHQNANNPLIPLLLEIKQQVVRRYEQTNKSLSIQDPSTFDAFRRGGLAALTLLERVADAACMLTKSTDNPVFTGTTEAVVKAWKGDGTSNGLTELSDGQRFHLQFEDAVKTVLQSFVADGVLDDAARLVIFIDDLDRCEESVVIQLLEAIKLYLGTSRCVFVLGMDTAAVLEALRHHWPTRSEDHNREYLEKLFQATVRVPAPQSLQVRTLLQTQLEKHNIPQAEDWAKKLVELIEPNPRKLKNFTNSLCATWMLHGLSEQPKSELLVGKLILFQYLGLYHPTVWRILERQPWALQILFRVLAGNSTDGGLALPDGYSHADQRMMEHYFSRSFSHVLSHNSESALDDGKHRGLDMDKAVDLFLERIDRKRSDEMFAKLAMELFAPTDAVDMCLLCIQPVTPVET